MIRLSPAWAGHWKYATDGRLRCAMLAANRRSLPAGGLMPASADKRVAEFFLA